MYHNIKPIIRNAHNCIDVLVEKSTITSVSEQGEKKFFQFIRRTYHDLQESFDRRTELFMEIVANDVKTKIVFFVSEHDNFNLKYEPDESETILIAANGYDKLSHYRKFLGVIANAFCNFAFDEMFGMKRYNESHSENSKKWKKLYYSYQEKCCLTNFPFIKEIFKKYPEFKWVNELFVRYVQFNVEHDNEVEKLQEFQKTFVEITKMYNSLEKQVRSEVIKMSALRYINGKTILGDKQSKIFVNTLKSTFECELESHRQVIKTNDTYLMMKNIYIKISKNSKFESEYMFMDLSFLEPDEHLDLIETALKRQKVVNLIIDCDSDAYLNPSTREQLLYLLNCHYNGRIILIFHENQVIEFKERCQSINFNASNLICLISSQDIEFKEKSHSINFNASNLTKEFKGSLKVYFQGSKLMLQDLINPDLINGSLSKLFNGKVYETFTKKEISIGHSKSKSKNHKIPKYYVCREYRQKTFDETINLDDRDVLREVFDKNRCVLVVNESGEGKTVESFKMYKRMKAAYPKFWIVHVNLADIKDFTETFDSSKSFLEFFTRDIMNIETVEKEIFEIFFKTGRVIFIFDSLDKTCEDMIKKIEKIVMSFSKTNKMCIFTRPYVVEASFKMERKNPIQIEIVELNNSKKIELARKIMESKEMKNVDVLIQKLFIFLNLVEKDEKDHHLDEIYECVHNFASVNPLTIKMATDVLCAYPDAFSDSVTSVYELYHYFLKSNTYFGKCGKTEILEILWKIAFENISSNALYKYRLKVCAKYDKEKRQDLNDFAEAFFPCHENDVIINSLIKCGFLINDNDSTYRFEDTSFEVHFIAHFIRENCEKFYKNKKYLNILCYIAMKLKETDRLHWLIEHLADSLKVVKYLSSLKVFKQIFNRNSIYNETFINIDPILIELCRSEPTFSKRFLIRFDDPLSNLKKIQSFKLSVFAECGEHSSKGYYVNYRDFKKMFRKCSFMRKKNSLLTKFIGSNDMKDSLCEELTSSLKNLSLFNDTRVIKLFLKLHEHYITEENYRKQSFLNDNVIKLLLNKNVDGDILNMLKSVLTKFCCHNNLIILEMFNANEFYFSKSPLELLLDCESVYDENLTKAALSFLIDLVKSEANFINYLFPDRLVKCFFKALINFPNEIYSMKVKVILEYILENFKVENVKEAFLFRRQNVSIQPEFDLFLEVNDFYDIQMCADEYKFNIIQLALLDNFKSPSKCFFEKISDDFMQAISNDAKFAMIIKEEIFNDEFLKILCKLICGDFFDKTKISKIVKYVNDAQYINRFLSFMVEFEKKENLEKFLDIILTVKGADHFVDFMLSYDRPLKSLIVQSPSIEHVDIILCFIVKFESFDKNVRNITKFLGLVSANYRLSNENIDILIKKYEKSNIYWKRVCQLGSSLNKNSQNYVDNE